MNTALEQEEIGAFDLDLDVQVVPDTEVKMVTYEWTICQITCAC